MNSKLSLLNDLLHVEPIAIVADCLFWCLVFLVFFPMAALVSLIRMVFLTWEFFTQKDAIMDPEAKKKQEYAILITGCDSGFGKDLVEPLTTRGFTVFCGCLHKDSFQHFKGNKLAIPIQMDVTSDKSVSEAFKTVSSWLHAGSSSGGSRGTKRYFHALVNNAGICKAGPIDWVTMADFKVSMEVNFFGLVRCSKESMAILKKQAAAGTYLDARIVNISSVAGFFDGWDVATPYVASKHAVEAFTANLRNEMNYWGVKVLSINPSFHQTPLADYNRVEQETSAMWTSLPKSLREQYGEDYFQAVLRSIYHLRWISWRKKNVVDAIEHAVIAKKPPVQSLVGIDAKYFFPPLQLLPSGIGIGNTLATPAMMKK